MSKTKKKKDAKKKKVKTKKHMPGVEERLKKIKAIEDFDDSMVRKENDEKLIRYHFRPNFNDQRTLREQRQQARRGPMRAKKPKKGIKKKF